MEEKEVITKDNTEIKGVGGFLLFFIISIAIFKPIACIYMVYNFIDSALILFNASIIPNPLWAIIIIVIINIVVILSSIFCGYSLYKIKTFAINITKLFLVLYVFVFAIEVIILTYIFGNLSDTSSYYSIIQSIGYSTIWYLYFTKSTRVKNTYYPSKTDLNNEFHMEV